MSDIKIVAGEIFEDHRGRIASLNAFRFPGVERFYFIHHSDIDVIRAWHGHQLEKKWFYCVRGAFTLAVVKVDNWEHPSPELVPEVFTLTAENSRIIGVPEGYANGIKADSPDSTLLVFSGKVLEEALQDSWRYDKNLWMDWEKKEPRYHA